MTILPRKIKEQLLSAAKDTPVVMLIGARQTGKSTLMQNLYPKSAAPRFISLDDLSILASASSEPQAFINNLPDRVIIDEIQRLPELLLPIKHSVDRNRQPGRFLLTGSANVLSLPRVADSLAGRMEIHTLWPLSQSELVGSNCSLIDLLFSSKKIPQVEPIEHARLVDAVCAGGYPDAVMRESTTRRGKWFESYLKSIIERDIRDLRQVEQLLAFPKLLTLLASRAGGLLNHADLARSMEMPVGTIRSYLALLQAIFLVVPVRPWFGNAGKRLVKSPKLYLNDTGLLCHLLGCDAASLRAGSQQLGRVYENFVLMEVLKQASWSKVQPDVYHFRTEGGAEVDIVLESRDGRIVGIECKSSFQAGPENFSGLKVLKEVTGAKFHRGIVLYAGTQTLSFGKGLYAVPVSALWEEGVF